jgi:heat shock protein HslJ
VVTDIAALSAIEWQLVAYTEDGREEVVLAPDVVAVIRFDGRGGFTSDGCNQQTGTVELTDGTLVGEIETSTLVDCGTTSRSSADGVFSSLLRGSTWRGQVDGLTAEADGLRAQLVAREPPFPRDWNPGSQVLLALAGDDGGLQVQVTAGHGVGPAALDWFLRIVWRREPGQPWNTRGDEVVGTDAVAQGGHASSTSVGNALAVHTSGVAGVSRAAHVTDDGTETPLDLHVLDAEHVVVTGIVFPPRPGVVVQWDAAGTELTRSAPLTGR